MPFSRESSWPMDRTRVSCIAGRYFTIWATRDTKEIKPVNCKGNQPWIFTERTDAEAQAPILWPPDAQSLLTGKDPDVGKGWKQEEKGMTEDEMVGWLHRLNGHEFEQALGEGEGQESLVCCCSWVRKELDMTERLNNKNNSDGAALLRRKPQPRSRSSTNGLAPGGVWWVGARPLFHCALFLRMKGFPHWVLVSTQEGAGPWQRPGSRDGGGLAIWGHPRLLQHCHILLPGSIPIIIYYFRRLHQNTKLLYPHITRTPNFLFIHSLNKLIPRIFSRSSIFFLMFIYLCIYLLNVLVAVGLHSCMWPSLVAVSRVYSSLQCTGFSLQWILLLQFPGSRHHKLR